MSCCFSQVLIDSIRNLPVPRWGGSKKAMAPHSSTLVWKIPWMEEPGRLQSMGSLRKNRTWLSDFTFTFHFHALEKEMATHSSVLSWRIPGKGEPGGLQSMGLHRVRHDWSDLAAAVWSKWNNRFNSYVVVVFKIYFLMHFKIVSHTFQWRY